ncbi:MAG: 4Fe-4S dicluster domain-containing protein [Candidatus Paceibacterota bacterium]|jgi:2-oxoglutarate ferredoxin oxidoreductase subunit delta|nr:4Fe-4S dicluster domain-containing protein [Candidatus Paceibacterota bacterium]
MNEIQNEPQKQETKTEPIWVIKGYCKSCKKCVYACPAGVLSMAEVKEAIPGCMISVDRPDLCIGCRHCEYACPDRAISVAEKNEFPFAKKITPEAKERQTKILANDCQSLSTGEKDEKAESERQ